ncbi:phytoene/squalene synthase family protein [Falsihalocynthiibacter sp. BN13B15]|uniref:phytoene/squalene synthase family protein n=1 Tax=Falsihalocynthiibacter sp. BN13B15 TaxID=3240871 RepID=UPI003510B82C
MMDYAVCAALVEKGDPDRFLATMAAAPALRGGLFTLAAYNLELARAPWASKEPMIAEMRLQWWRDLIDEIAAKGVVRTHEVSASLVQCVQEFGLSAQNLDQMAAARLWDAYTEPFADQDDFDEYIDHTAGHLMWMACQTLGAQPDDEKSVRAYAYGVGVAAWLAAVADLVERGKIPLLDGRDEGVKSLAQRGLERMQSAKPSRNFAPALRWGWQAEPLLKLAIKSPERVGDGSLYLPEFSRKARLLRKSVLGRY